MTNIEIKIWTMDKGKIKEIIIPEFDNQIFVVKEKQETTQQKTETTLDKAYNAVRELRQKQEQPDKGHVVYFKDKRTLHSNVIKECKEQQEQGNYDFLSIIEKYYPNLKKTSYTRYLCDYRSYLGIKVGKGNRIKKVRKSYYRMPTIKQVKKRRRRRIKPTSDSVGFNKKYNVWIKEGELQKVKLAINTVGWGYVPNTNTIIEKTGLTKGRASATLDYMINKGMTKRIYKNGTYVYEMI